MVFKKFCLFSLLLFLTGLSPKFGFSQDAYRMKMLSNYNNPNLPKVDGTDIWNDLTGYVDPIKKREYIICGSTDSVYFFDITNPQKMNLVDVEDGASFFARNRDFETYKHYAYCVSDQASGVGALQIFDLQYLPDSVHKVYESNVHGTFTHTIFIDTLSERLYLSSNLKPGGFSALDVLSLTNPEAPTFFTKLKVPKRSDGFDLFNRVHEMYARHDTIYLSCENTGLYIFDLSDTAQHLLIGSITSYPDQGYNHSSWLDASGKYLMFTDENMGLDIKIFDIKSLSNPQFVSQFNSNAQTTSHNAYWYGDFAYVSAYHDGVRIYNVKDPGNPKQVAWYDTHPETPELYGGYKGCWGVYPFLPSKHIIASDLTSGIFVFELDSQLIGEQEIRQETMQVNVYPNPSQNSVWVQTEPNFSGTLTLFDARGTQLEKWEVESSYTKINLSHYASGAYFIRIQNNQQSTVRKLMKGE